MTDKELLYMMFTQNPEGLAIALRVLFEPYNDAMYSVLHNKAVDLMITLAGARGVEPDSATGKLAPVGVPELKCKRELARALAQAVLHHARPDDSTD